MEFKIRVRNACGGRCTEARRVDAVKGLKYTPNGTVSLQGAPWTLRVCTINSKVTTGTQNKVIVGI